MCCHAHSEGSIDYCEVFDSVYSKSTALTISYLKKDHLMTWHFQSHVWLSDILAVWSLTIQSEKEHDAKLAEQRQKQQELIQQLKSQLEDLENYAYQVYAQRKKCFLVCSQLSLLLCVHFCVAFTICQQTFCGCGCGCMLSSCNPLHSLTLALPLPLFLTLSWSLAHLLSGWEKYFQAYITNFSQTLKQNLEGKLSCSLISPFSVDALVASDW